MSVAKSKISNRMTEQASNVGEIVPVRLLPRRRTSLPITILAVLFAAATFLTWYFTWFGRELSDADIGKYLADEKHPRHVQHALLQIQQRLERSDPSVRQWYPRIVELAANTEPEFRLTSASAMGFDNRADEF